MIVARHDARIQPGGDFDHIETADAKQNFATYLREIGLARQAAIRHGSRILVPSGNVPGTLPA